MYKLVVKNGAVHVVETEVTPRLLLGRNEIERLTAEKDNVETQLSEEAA